MLTRDKKTPPIWRRFEILVGQCHFDLLLFRDRNEDDSYARSWKYFRHV